MGINGIGGGELECDARVASGTLVQWYTSTSVHEYISSLVHEYTGILVHFTLGHWYIRTLVLTNIRCRMMTLP